MSLEIKKLQILTISFENLKENPPQLISSTTIVDKLDIDTGIAQANLSNKLLEAIAPGIRCT